MSFGQTNIDEVMTRYEKLLAAPHETRIKNSRLAAIAFGYSFAIRFLYLGIIFYASLELQKKLELNMMDTLLAIYVIFLSSIGGGSAFSRIPSIKAAKASA